MILSRWSPQIAPINFTPKEIPTWIVLEAIPPSLVTPKGLSWLASQIGRPVNNFVRDGLDVKVCVIRDVDEAPKEKLDVVLAGGEERSIQVEYPEPRSYSRKAVHVRTTVVRGAVPQSSSYVPKGTSSGNAVEPQVGEKAPESISKGPTGGGVGNESKTSFEVADPPTQQTLSGLSPGRVRDLVADKDGMLVSDCESEEELVVETVEKSIEGDNAECSGAGINSSEIQKGPVVIGEFGVKQMQKPNFMEFLNQGKVISPKGVITRPKTRRR
ncbi:hypothetical protein LINPERPRIM_LOCUS32851 [Linum perenne]